MAAGAMRRAIARAKMAPPSRDDDGDGDREEVLQRILADALGIEDRAERSAFLERSCGGDEGLFRKLNALIRDSESGRHSASATTLPATAGRHRPEDAGWGGEAAAFIPGAVVAQRYRIVSLLGKGGMGMVYRADDLKLGQPVALKFLPDGLELKRPLLEALYNEVRQARKVSHRHVCRVYDIGEADGRHFLSMEYIEGEDLGSLLRRIGRLPRDKAIELARQLCRGLEAAHGEGLLHLDLKPANLMIDGRGDLRVTDFGLARLAEDSKADNRVAGTPAYMAPEQISEGAASPRSDVYAAGLVIYEMLVGERLCRGATLDEISAFHLEGGAATGVVDAGGGIDPGCAEIIRRCLAVEPDGRPGSIGEVLGELEALDAGRSAVLPAAPGSASAAGDGEEAEDDPVDAISSSDVYLAYAPIDNEPLVEGKPGWVSQFHRNLEVRSQQLLGEKVSIWRPPKSPDHEEVEDLVLDHLPEVKAMVPVVSPPFAHSDACLREVSVFRDRLGPLFKVDGQPRLLPAVKTPVEPRDLAERSSAFEGLRGFEFYEKDPLTGRVREFEEAFGEEARQHYYERVYDLAFNLCNVLRAYRQVAAPNAPRAGSDTPATVFLAATTSDLGAHHDRMRRELLELGLRVVPDRPLATHQADLEREVSEYLKTCDCIVQIVGPTYGIVPENARHSLLELQNGWAAERARLAAVPRFIWMPHGMVVEDDRQRAFVENLREVDAGEPTTELLEGTLNAFRDRLVRRLSPAEDTGDEGGETADDTEAKTAAKEGPPLLYLICDQRDEQAVEALEDYLFELGLQVVLPEFSADQDEVATLHRDQLVECDAVMVYYGAARKAWVDIKLRDVVKAVGYGREAPVPFQAVFVAPPEDRRKERFKAHAADVVRQTGGNVRDCEGLAAFAEKVLGSEGRKPGGDRSV